MKLTTLMLLSTIALSTVLKANEIAVPVISKPAVLQEGTQKELTAAQIAELLPWAKDSKAFLIDLLESTQGLASSDKLDRLVDGLKTVVGESAPKNTELLMRYTINRGLVIVDVLNKETNADAVGSIDAKTRVLVSTIKMAIKYYETDMATLSKKSAAPFVTYGLDYFGFLSELNKSIFDASAQYSIQRTSLEWLQWDLYRDLNSASYASQIVKINNSLKIFPTKKVSDAQALSYVRQIKGISSQLNLSANVKIVSNEKQIISNEKQIISNDKKIISNEVDYGSVSSGDKSIIKTFNTPQINGIVFDYSSDETGACKALGYSKGLAKTYAENTSAASLLTFDSSGKIVTVGTEFYMKELTCMGKANSDYGLTLTVITSPTLNDIPLSYDGESEGICKVLGYAKGVPGSATYEEYSSTMITANNDGTIKAGATEGYRTKSVICITKQFSSPTLKATLYRSPKIQGQNIAYGSSEVAVCNFLGSKGAATGAKTYVENTGTSIIVDDKGNITGQIDGYKMQNLICIDRN